MHRRWVWNQYVQSLVPVDRLLISYPSSPETLFFTEAFHLGLVLGTVPVQISRNKSHNYRAFGPILAPPTPSTCR